MSVWKTLTVQVFLDERYRHEDQDLRHRLLRSINLFLVISLALGPLSPLFAKGPNDKENKKAAEAQTYPPLLIGPGDLLAIVVYGEQALPIEYQVDSNGVITVPYIGNVVLGGMSPAEASAKLARLLAKPRKVTVLIKESNTYWVSVLGNVGNPGKYQIKGKPTLLSALAEAGGPLPNTDMGGVILIHKSQKNKVDLSKYLSGTGPMEKEPYMYPGDALMVPKSAWPTMGEIAIVISVIASSVILVDRLSN